MRSLALRNRLLAVTLGLLAAAPRLRASAVIPEPEPEAPEPAGIERDPQPFAELAREHDAEAVRFAMYGRTVSRAEAEAMYPHREPETAETPDEHDDRLDRAAEAELEKAKGTIPEPVRQFWPRRMRHTPLYLATRQHVARIYLS